ncbi:MAG: zf-HC2 domain-containing protein [Candidatus Brocadiales bacterium]
MKCEKIQELVLMDYLDDEMGAEQLEQVEKHLAACAHCREFETMAKQTVFEPFMNVERVSSPESVWYQIKKTIEVKGEEAVVASFFENFMALFSVKRPVLALSIITVVLIIAVSITQFLPFHKQSDTQDVVNVYLAEQIEYIAYLDENGEFDTNYGTGIEEYFLSEGNF